MKRPLKSLFRWKLRALLIVLALFVFVQSWFLVQVVFLSGERSLVRKGQEAIITVMLETVWDKRRILEVYLNVVEWGDGVYGAEAAARHHFGRRAASLTPMQAAELAVMLPRPRHYDQVGMTPYLAWRADNVESWMRGARIP